MIRKFGEARWRGGLRNGDGDVSTETGVLSRERYSFAQRFGDERGTNPEELIGAAHAACFAMAFSATLERAGLEPQEIEARSTVSLDTGSGASVIDHIHIDMTARVPGADETRLRELAEDAKANCPVSKLLGGATITLSATFL
jgi:osmotically inducible protein OsmC